MGVRVLYLHEEGGPAVLVVRLRGILAGDWMLLLAFVQLTFAMASISRGFQISVTSYVSRLDTL